MADATDIKNISSFLFRIRLQRIFVLFLIGISLFFSAQIAVLLICGSIVKLFSLPFAGIVFAIVSVVIGCYISIKYLIMPIVYIDTESCASLLERYNQFLDNRLINSLQLTDPGYPYNYQFSQTLIGSLVKDTARVIQEIDVSKIIPFKDFTKELSRLVLLIFILALTDHFSPGLLSEAISAIFHPLLYSRHSIEKHEPMQFSNTAPLPQIGDIELTYIYPSYTGLSTVVIKNSSGDINVLKGSEVIVRAKVSSGVESAILNINNTDIPMKIDENHFASGKIVVMDNGDYYIAVKDTEGNSNPDPIRHRILVKEDEYPEVSILFPEDMIEVKAIDQLELQYRYSDDFGIKKLALVYDIKDRMGYSVKKGRETLSGAEGNKGDGKHLWNMALLPLKEGGRIKYHLEIFDNDLISGTKKSGSEELYIKIYDSEEGHNEVIFNQEKIIEELLVLLADKLENPLGESLKGKIFYKEKQMDEHLMDIIAMIESLLSGLEKDYFADPVTSLAYKNIKERLLMVNKEKAVQLLWLDDNLDDDDTDDNIDSMTISFINEFWEREVAEIETDIIEMDRLIKKEKLNSLYKREDDLADAQDSLLDLISNLSDMEKDDAIEKFEKMLNRIDDLFREFMEKMFSLSKELPDEFINSEAVKNINEQDMRNIMKKIRDALKKGDMEKASQLAEELASQMENMLNSLMSAAEGLAGSGLFAEMENLDSAVNKANELLDKEKKFLDDTEKMDAELAAKMEDIFQEKMDAFKQKIRTLTAILNKRLKDMRNIPASKIMVQGMVSSQILRINNDIRSMLGSLDSDLGKSKSISENIVRRLRTLSARLKRLTRSRNKTGDSMNLLLKTKEAQAAGEMIMNEFNKFMSHKPEADKDTIKRMMEMAERQENIKKNTMELRKALEDMDGAELFLGTEMFNQIGKAVNGMGKAEGGLKDGDISLSLDGERDAVANLSKAAERLEKFQKEAKKMMGGMFVMKPFSPKGIGSSKNIRGKVYIPSEEDYKVPKEFRDEILKAMQGGAPARYKDKNKRYYKGLLK